MYEIFEHTADLGIRVRAGSLDELFADAARGLFSVMVANLDAVRDGRGGAVSDRRRQSRGTAARLAGGIALHVSRPPAGAGGVSTCRVDVPVGALTATARGEPIDPSRHEIDDEVKAITWHALKVEQQAEGWMAEVIVDV